MKPAEIRFQCLKLQADAGNKPDTAAADVYAAFFDGRVPSYALESLRLALAKKGKDTLADADAFYLYLMNGSQEKPKD